MPDYPTSNLFQMSAGAANQEARVNELVDAFAPFGSAFGRNANTLAGLTLGYYGVARIYVNDAAVTKANATLALTGSSTRYVSASRALALSEQATVFAPDKLAVFKATTSGSAITALEDHRDIHHTVRFFAGYVSIAMANANVTLTYEQAMCDCLDLTGANTAQRDVIVPLVPRAWDVICSTTSNGIRVIGASGTGVTIAVGKSQRVFCDGTNVRAIGAPSP